jgi:hypothetical protein
MGGVGAAADARVTNVITLTISNSAINTDLFFIVLNLGSIFYCMVEL